MTRWILCAALVLGACSPLSIKQTTPLIGGDAQNIDGIILFDLASADQINIPQRLNDLYLETLQKEVAQVVDLTAFLPDTGITIDTVILSTAINHFEVTERRAEEFNLREIFVDFKVGIALASDPQNQNSVDYKYVLQRIYFQKQAIGRLGNDIDIAIQEVAKIALSSIFYQQESSSEKIAKLLDEADHRLWHGYQFQLAGELEETLQYYYAVLFNPEPQDLEELFFPNQRMYDSMADSEELEPLISTLKALDIEDPLDIDSFRAKLEEAFGERIDAEAKLIELADYRTDRTYYNLSMAHFMLGQLFATVKRFDLAEYHLARSWLNYNLPEIITTWHDLQLKRGIISKNVSELLAISQYARIEHPPGVQLLPGNKERRLFTPVVYLDNRSIIPIE